MIALHWPREADREHYRAKVRRQYPHFSDERVEEVARDFAELDRKCESLKLVTFVRDARFTRLVPHEPHGFAVVDAEAA